MYKRFLHYCKKKRDNLIKTSDILCAGLIATHKGPSTNYTAPNSGCVCSYCNRVMPNPDNSDKSVANKTESVKRKITDLSLEDNESLDSPSAGKKPTGSLKTPEKMAGANSSHVLAPAKFTVPSNDDLDRAIEDHVHQESMDSENEQGAVGGTSTFASKAKKAKVDYPFALYIVAGTDQERKPMTRAHFVEFEKYLFNTIGRAVVDDNLEISIDFTIWRGSYGLVAAVTDASSKWVKTHTKAFKFEEQSTRAYNRWENQQAYIFSVFLSGEMFKQKTCRPNWVTGKILDHNKLQGSFQNAVLDKKSNKDGAYLSFEPTSQDLIDKLNSKSRLNCILSNPVLHRRLRKQRTKEEFLELFNKKGNTNDGEKPHD